MKKFLVALLLLCCTAVSALAQSTITLPIAANAVADIGNGPIKVRMLAGNASIFTAQSSGVGSTSGSSTTLTLTTTPATPPIVGGLISGTGITSGTTVTAYNGTTGITLSAAMTVAGGTTVSWGAACPSSSAGIPAYYIQASAMADYYIMYTQARVCAVSPGGPVNTLLIEPIYYSLAFPVTVAPVTGSGALGNLAVWAGGPTLGDAGGGAPSVPQPHPASGNLLCPSGFGGQPTNPNHVLTWSDQSQCWTNDVQLWESFDPSALLSITLSGTPNTGDVEVLTFHFNATAVPVQYTVKGGDSLTKIASCLVDATASGCPGSGNVGIIQGGVTLYNNVAGAQGQVLYVTNVAGVIDIDFNSAVSMYMGFTSTGSRVSVAYGGTNGTQACSSGSPCVAGLDLNPGLETVRCAPTTSGTPECVTPAPGSQIWAHYYISASSTGAADTIYATEAVTIQNSTSGSQLGRWILSIKNPNGSDGIYVGSGLCTLGYTCEGLDTIDTGSYYVAGQEQISRSSTNWLFAAVSGDTVEFNGTAGFGFGKIPSANGVETNLPISTFGSTTLPTAGSSWTLTGGASPASYCFNWGASTYLGCTSLGLSFDFKPSNGTGGVTIATNVTRPDANNATTLGDATHGWSTIYGYTLQLGVQQTTQGALVLNNTAAGSFATTVQSSNSASAAWTMTLPTTAGTNGYLLTTNGSGVLSWTNPATVGGVNSVGNASADTTLTIAGTGSGPWTGAVTIKCTVATASQVGCLSLTSPTFVTPVLGVAAGTSLALGTQQTIQGALILDNTAAGSFATTIKSSNSASAAWTLTLPTTAGTNTYVLQTDGSGNTSWVANGGGGSYLPLAGGTMSGDIAMGGHNISGGGTFTATTLGGTLSTAAQPNITSVGTLTSLTVSGLLVGNSSISSSGAGSTPVTGQDVTITGGSTGVVQAYDWGAAAYLQLNIIGQPIHLIASNATGTGVVVDTGVLRPETTNATTLGNASHIWSDIWSGSYELFGSSTGRTTFTSANAGASNFTLTFPAATDQLVGRATTDTLTNKTLASTTDTLGGVTMGVGSDAQGDIYYANASLVLSRLAHGTTSQVLIGGTTPSWGAATSAMLNITATTCTNQFVTAISSGAVGTCTTATLASAQFANQGTTATLLHGNASGNPSWGAVVLTTDVSGTLPIGNGGTGQVSASAAFNALSPMTTAGDIIYGGASGAGTRLAAGTTSQVLIGGTTPSWGAVTSAMLSITTTTCTNQFVTAISSGGVGTCTTDTLAGAQHANQGTTTTVLHGNAAGNPSWAAVTLTTDVTGALPIGNGGTGQATASAAFNALSPMTTAGDIIYGGASGAGTRLAAGSSTQVLTGGTTPAWATSPTLNSVTAANGASGGFIVTMPSGSNATFQGGGGGGVFFTMGSTANQFYVRDSSLNPVFAVSGAGNATNETMAVNGSSALSTASVQIFATQAASSTSTGALQVSGGIGALGTIYAALTSAGGADYACFSSSTGALSYTLIATACAVSGEEYKDVGDRLSPTRMLDIVSRLDLRSYHYNERGKRELDMDSFEHWGSTAQRVAAVEPFLAIVDPEHPEHDGIKINEMWPVLAGAIQKLNDEIGSLRVANDNLQLEVKQLRSRMQ